MLQLVCGFKLVLFLLALFFTIFFSKINSGKITYIIFNFQQLSNRRVGYLGSLPSIQWVCLIFIF